MGWSGPWRGGVGREVGLEGVVGWVSHALYVALRHIISDTALQRSERCQDGSGLELWRRLYQEVRGASPQATAVQAAQFLQPPRAVNSRALWGALGRSGTFWGALERGAFI